jgi:hypothetical protein
MPVWHATHVLRKQRSLPIEAELLSVIATRFPGAPKGKADTAWAAILRKRSKPQ